MAAMSVGKHAVAALSADESAAYVAEINPHEGYDEYRQESVAYANRRSPAEEEIYQHAQSQRFA